MALALMTTPAASATAAAVIDVLCLDTCDPPRESVWNDPTLEGRCDDEVTPA
jgi:hypothetical protein